MRWQRRHWSGALKCDLVRICSFKVLISVNVLLQTGHCICPVDLLALELDEDVFGAMVVAVVGVVGVDGMMR